PTARYLLSLHDALPIYERRVLGMWVASDEGAVLVWAEDRAASQKAAEAPLKAAGEAAFGNVIYAAPKGWKTTVATDSVTLTPDRSEEHTSELQSRENLV